MKAAITKTQLIQKYAKKHGLGVKMLKTRRYTFKDIKGLPFTEEFPFKKVKADLKSFLNFLEKEHGKSFTPKDIIKAVEMVEKLKQIGYFFY